MKATFTKTKSMLKPILSLLLLLAFHLPLVAQVRYYESEAEQNDDYIEFAFITDTHKFGPTADERKADLNIKAFVKYCQEHPSLLFAAHGGDMMNAYNTNHEQALWSLQQSQIDFDSIPQPFFTTRGNHDCNGKARTSDGKPDNSQIITNREYYDLFNPCSGNNSFRKKADVVVDSLNPYGNYYYCDFPVQRFRLIVLNDYDQDSLEVFGYHGQQMKWLCEQALNFENKALPSTWSFLIIGHYFSANLFENAISRLMHAYVNGEDFEDTDSGVSYSAPFHRLHRALCIGLLCGHQHEDYYSNKHGYNIINVTRGFATGSEVDNDDVSFDHFIIDRRAHTIRENRIGRGRSRQYSYEPAYLLSPRVAFAEADGMGMNTYGGHGGKLIRVTNLKDDGEGSLRWAVNQTGARYVVFDVSGNIELKSPLVIKNDYITIAGQSAPGKGICIKGTIKIEASEVVMRYLRIRPGETNSPWKPDAISDSHWGQHNIILDHLSVSWSEGSGIAIRYTQNATVQFCLISQSLITEKPKIGETEAPGLLAGGIMCTYYRNIIANHVNAIQFPVHEGENRWPHVIRNVIYNWRDHAMWGGDEQGEINIEENHFIPGPATPKGSKMLDVAKDGTARYYLAWNTYEGVYTNSKSTELVNDRTGVPYHPLNPDQYLRSQMTYMARPSAGGFSPTCITEAAFHYKPISGWVSPDLLVRQCLYSAGCSLHRDTYDSLVVVNMRRGTAISAPNGIISSSKPLEYTSRIPYKQHVQKYANHEDFLDRKVAFEKSIVILFDNDVLSNVENYPKLAGYRDAILGDTALVGIVSAGDFLSGGIYGNISKGKFVVDAMREVGYDAVNMGNYEWRFDIDHTRKLMSELGPIATSCNTYRLNEKKNVYAPYVMHNYNGKKVAYVGVTSPHTLYARHDVLYNDNGRPLYHFSTDTLIMRVQHTVDEARRHGANYVVLLSSLGEGSDYYSHSTKELISRTRRIDAVFDSYAKSELDTLIRNLEGKRIPLLRNEDNFKSIGKLVIAPDGVITSELIKFNDLQFKNPRVSVMLDSIHDSFAAHTDKVIAYADTLVDNNGKNGYLRKSEAPLGNLVADALRQVVGTRLAIINSGAIRKRLLKGPITRLNCMDVLPFNNDIYIVQMTGVKLQKALIEMARLAPNQIGTFFQVSGMRYYLQEGRGISGLEILSPKTGQYERLDPLATYSVAITDYVLDDPLYKGAFNNCPKQLYDSFKDVDVLMQYIQINLNGRIPSSYGRVEDRITVVPKKGNTDPRQGGALRN